MSGYRVDLAMDGDIGLIRERPPIAVITIDPCFQALTGYRHSTAAEDEIVTPALIVSALGEVESRVRGRARAAMTMSSSSFAFAELLARVERWLGAAAPRKGNSAAHRRSFPRFMSTAIALAESRFAAAWFQVLEYLVAGSRPSRSACYAAGSARTSLRSHDGYHRCYVGRVRRKVDDHRPIRSSMLFAVGFCVPAPG